MNKKIFTSTCVILLVTLCGVMPPPSLNAADFLFTWSPGPVQSVAAYGVYQRAGDAPYELIAQVQVEDLDDPTNPSYMVTGLSEGNTYRFAATTISAAGTESDFSSQTCITVNGQVVECTDTDENGTTVFVSCFISAAGEWRSRRTPQR
jgi:fibronectin type 3 domain-containing protein